MIYVHLLENDAPTPERYIGMSSQLRRRLAKHNAGKSLHTAKFRPRIRQKTSSAISDQSESL